MIEFLGQRWRVHECALRASLPLVPQNAPQVWWALDVGAHPVTSITTSGDSLRILTHPLFFAVRDWREIGNLELTVDSQWQDAHEFVNDDGEVQSTEAEARWWPDQTVNHAHYWLCDQFALRMGSWDGAQLACEFEGAFTAEREYHRDLPDAAPSAGPDRERFDLLLMTMTKIAACEVEVPGEVKDPIAWARARRSREIGFSMPAERARAKVRALGPQQSNDGNPAGVRTWKVSFTPELG